MLSSLKKFLRRLPLVQRLRHRASTLEARRERIARLYLRGEGIEVGALNRRLRVPEAAKVRYVDRLTVAALRVQYPELAKEKLVEPDIIDDGERLTTIRDNSQDFVVANHFVEHCQDPISALANMLRVLKNGGILFLAIPDKRYSPDCNRPLTSNEHLLKDYRDGPLWSKRQHFEEFVRLWAHAPLQEAEAVENKVRELMDTDYSIHYHVWTQATFMGFVLVLQDELAANMGLHFEIEQVLKNESEVVVIFRKAE